MVMRSLTAGSHLTPCYRSDACSHSRQSTGKRSQYLFLLVQHNVRLETSHSGELLVTDGAGGVLPIVGAFVQCQVEFNIECLGTLVTAMWLFGEKSKEALKYNCPAHACSITAPRTSASSTACSRSPEKSGKPALDLKSACPKQTRQRPAVLSSTRSVSGKGAPADTGQTSAHWGFFL